MTLSLSPKASRLRKTGSVSPSPRFAESAEQNGERAGVRCLVGPSRTRAVPRCTPPHTQDGSTVYILARRQPSPVKALRGWQAVRTDTKVSETLLSPKNIRVGLGKRLKRKTCKPVEQKENHETPAPVVGIKSIGKCQSTHVLLGPCDQCSTRPPVAIRCRFCRHAVPPLAGNWSGRAWPPACPRRGAGG